MKASRITLAAVALLLSTVLALAGCGNPEAKSKVDGALGSVESAQPLLEDLLLLDERLNTLGTRFTNVDDTIAEGKSLAEMALMDVSELEARYAQARDILVEVTGMAGAGDYAAYAELALEAVDAELEAMAMNRQLLTAVWDMLDVLPLAESREQLSFYTSEIERLTGEVSDLLQLGADAAAEADRYYREKGL
jgi:uncharacterized small protein (DUF1192 family)